MPAKTTPSVAKPIPFAASVYKDGSYTCICIDRTDKTVKFIPMASLDIETATPREFDAQWTMFPEYPVKRAAEKYLLSVQYRTIPAKAHEHLSSIAAEAAEYATFESLNPVTKPTEGKSQMASKKSAPNGLDTVVSGAKPKAAGKPAAKPAAKAAAPAKTKPAAPPAKTAAAKPAAKAAAPAKTKPAVPAKAPKAADTAKYKLGDTSQVKRGFMAEYVEKAQALKTFTRDSLEAEFGGRQGSPEAQKMGTYFPYAVGKGIFVAAK